MKYFSKNYGEARARFLDACQAVGAKVESFQNAVPGYRGEPLFTDTAYLGSVDADDILVVGSGTHGVEGFAGSGIQTGLLKSGTISNLKPNTGVLLIHALNPYGFAHLRRWNEDNVDLNRNFGDHSKAHPVNTAYEQLRDVIDPESMTIGTNARSVAKLLWYGLRNGKKKLQEAVSQGQYSNPKGLFYGGREETWSNKTLHTIARKYLLKAQHVVVVDIHTGLGPHGKGELIVSEKEHSPAAVDALQMWGDRVKSTLKGESVSVRLQGAIRYAYSKFLPNGNVTVATLEFGTFSPTKVFWALRKENWLHHYAGINHPQSLQIKSDLLKAFYPNTEYWNSQVWDQGNLVVKQALAHMR